MNIQHFFFPALLLSLYSCNGQQEVLAEEPPVSGEIAGKKQQDSVNILDFFQQNKGNHQPSTSQGTVSNGALINGKLVPYFGKNFSYFDTKSYFASRGYTNDKVLSTILDAYQELETEEPGRFFYLMELSNKEGGNIFPHRTHQNGLSADFMIPKLKNGLPYYGLDTLGKDHYFLEFNNRGEYIGDTSVKADLNLVARHILLLQKKAAIYGYRISKVIIKVEYKELLFSTPYGKLLKKSGVYFAQHLTPLINDLHDDHYHIDFEPNK